MDPTFVPAGVSPYLTLTAMITPAIFMTACGSLIISTSNRMARVVDRIRSLNDHLDKLQRSPGEIGSVPERIQHYNEQLDQLEFRSDRIRIALAQLYAAMGVFVTTSLSLAIDARLGHALGEVPTFLAAIGVCLLLGASLQLFREARLALYHNRLEVKFFRQLRMRKN